MTKAPDLTRLTIPEGQTLASIPGVKFCDLLGISRSQLYQRYGSPPWVGIGANIFRTHLGDVDRLVGEKIDDHAPSRDILGAIIDSCIEVAVDYPGVGPATSAYVKKAKKLKQMPHEAFPRLYKSTLKVIEYGQYVQADMTQTNPFEVGKNFVTLTLARIAFIDGPESAELFTETRQSIIQSTGAH